MNWIIKHWSIRKNRWNDCIKHGNILTDSVHSCEETLSLLSGLTPAHSHPTCPNYKMSLPVHYYCAFLFLLVTHCPTQAVEIQRLQILDEDFQVEWRADLEEEIISFTITAKALGYVGFGLSPHGRMAGADIVIGGVKDGKPYFADYHGTGNTKPEVDLSQDWTLLCATENDTHTTLTVSRVFNTCDLDDLPINNDTTKFIWSVGATDVISKHVKNGVASVIILDSAYCEWNASDYEVWQINSKVKLPTDDTTYWCTAHKSPFVTERHIVGFKVKLGSKEALKHTHHLILHHCKGSSKEDFALYEQILRTSGGHCYNDSSILEMKNTCEEYLYGWAIGSDSTYLPENVGIPLNENGLADYFLLEIHYDNPDKMSDLNYAIGIELYTTTKLREHKAGILRIGNDADSSLMIPPNTSNFTVVGHCSSCCTNERLPKQGINVVSVLLHSHIAGRQMKLRHFRNGKELPWVAYDNNYDFNYQQNRKLPKHVKILRGDQLTYECTDESAGRSPPAAVLGGLSTRNEMCLVFLTYYPRVELDYCGSYFGTDHPIMLKLLGIDKIGRESFDPLVLAPPEYAYKRYSDVLSNLIHWNDTLKLVVQNLSRFGDHIVRCQPSRTSITDSTVQYPDMIAYKPKNICCQGIVMKSYWQVAIFGLCFVFLHIYITI